MRLEDRHAVEDGVRSPGGVEQPVSERLVGSRRERSARGARLGVALVLRDGGYASGMRVSGTPAALEVAAPARRQVRRQHVPRLGLAVDVAVDQRGSPYSSHGVVREDPPARRVREGTRERLRRRVEVPVRVVAREEQPVREVCVLDRRRELVRVGRLLDRLGREPHRLVEVLRGPPLEADLVPEQLERAVERPAEDAAQLTPPSTITSRTPGTPSKSPSQTQFSS